MCHALSARQLHRARVGEEARTALSRAPKGHIKIRILPSMVSGIPLMLGIGTECALLMLMWFLGP